MSNYEEINPWQFASKGNKSFSIDFLFAVVHLFKYEKSITHKFNAARCYAFWAKDYKKTFFDFGWWCWTLGTRKMLMASASLFVANKKRSRSKVDFAPAWWRWRDLNPRPKNHSFYFLRAHPQIIIPPQSVRRTTQWGERLIGHDGLWAAHPFMFTANRRPVRSRGSLRQDGCLVKQQEQL